MMLIWYGLLVVTRANDFGFGIAEESGWFLFHFKDSVMCMIYGHLKIQSVVW